MTEQEIYTVSQITGAIKNELEEAFPYVCVEGEISNFKAHSSGHLYFSLKDSHAQIAAIAYRGDAAKFPVVPKDGQKVIVKGSVNVYPAGGRYQITVKELKLAGVGELLLKLHELKLKLHKLGWFSQERKKPLPKDPKVIGVVTSPTGAAIQDILNILTRRASGFHLLLNPVRVQGEGAAAEIAQAIRQFNEYGLADVLIVGRGGGSVEDLWAFNEEIVAEAIYHSKIPIICAVGHETDHCIAEYVADLRAPTPSAAAEIVLGEKEHQFQQLEQYRVRAVQHIKSKLQHQKQIFQRIVRQPHLSNPYFILGPWMQRLDDLRQRLESLKPIARIAFHREHLKQLVKQLEMRWERIYRSRLEKLHSMERTIKAVNPKNLLAQGYSIVFDEKEGKVVKSVDQVTVGENLKILVSDGTLITKTTEVMR